jgi:TetR/AcrR family transcriptional repressor of mexCD-oprJ operon
VSVFIVQTPLSEFEIEVMTSHHTPAPAPPRRRADAERSIARILDATVEALAADPDVSMAEIARRAGVVRATIYVHFPSREALLQAVTHRAIAETAEVIEAAEPHRGDPADALARVVAASWRHLGHYHALVAINTQQRGHDELRHRHASALDALKPLIERGQAAGSFRADVPAAWHLSMVMALIHAGSGELGARRVTDTDAEPALVATVLGAVSAAHPTTTTAKAIR